MKRIIILIMMCYSMSSYALDYENCGKTWHIDHTPNNIIVLNQNMADILIALHANLVGVSYLDDESLLPQNNGTYKGIKIISQHYPSAELLYSKNIDFIAAGYSSAFNTEEMLNREQLAKNNVGTYLLSFACSYTNVSSFKMIINDIKTLGDIVNRKEQADAIIKQIKEKLYKVSTIKHNKIPSVFYYDSGVSNIYTKGKKSFITYLINKAGGKNIFDDENIEYFTTSPEMLIMRNPDIILIANTVWSTAESKIQYMENDPVLSTLSAVKNKRFIILPFSRLYPGLYTIDGLVTLSKDIKKYSETL